MISKTLYALESAFSYLKRQPQLLFALLLLLVVPLLFLYSGQQFLEVGRSNQDRLQKDRVGLMQDVFASLLTGTNFNLAVIQTEINTITKNNPDITAFRIVRNLPSGYIPVAAQNLSVLGVPESETEVYERAAFATDDSVIFEFSGPDGRVWQSVRTVMSEQNEPYIIFTQFSLAQVDALFKQKERDVLWSLSVVYLFFLGIAYWLIKQNDFRSRYLEIKKANEAKDQFINMIAHELRAPLTAIKGYASMTEEQAKSHTIETYAMRIRLSAERLVVIVNDLLDVARIQSGKLAVEKNKLDVSEVVTAVVDELKISAAEKNIGLKSLGTDQTYEVIGDQKRLHQALTNLVSNAIKYTKEGAIELEVSDKKYEVELRVKDTGMGISAEDQQRLFAPFFRVNNEDVSQITGTGLGMWITKQLIELMGASIGVESIKGVGTHIVVKLPKNTDK